MELTTIKIIIISHVFLLNFITWIHFMMNKGNEVKRISPYKENPMIASLKLFFLAPIFIWAFTPYLNFANLKIPFPVQIIGIIAIVSSLLLFILSHVQLGKNWWYTPRIDTKHQFVTTGLYKYIRHPMYSVAFLGFGAYFLASGNWIVGSVPVFCFWILYKVRVNKEEELMQEEFGEAYLKYTSRVNRLFPKFFSQR